jgi:tetraacyldisaccharide 4'-kinase
LRNKLIFLLYRVLLVAAFPFLIVYVLYRGVRDTAYFVHVLERFGFLPRYIQPTSAGAIWLHAVSVGEVLSLMGLIRRLREECGPTPIYVSVGTLAGRRVADDKLRPLVDAVFQVPFDYCFAVRRVLRRLVPSVVVILETEIWPNLFRETNRSGAGLLMVNARISDKAFPSYQRWRSFFAPVLTLPEGILAQSNQDKLRFIELGAPPAIVENAGNLKYDIEPSAVVIAEDLSKFFQTNAGRPVWIAASTTAPVEPGDPDEDDVLIQAYREIRYEHPELLLLIAPRKPERFDIVAAKLSDSGLSFARRSSLDSNARPQVLLLDSFGELGALFGFADLVFMGGTLPQRGGHNILEPAAAGTPIILGPHMENFAEIADRFRKANAVVPIEGAGDLAGAARRLLSDPELRSELGRKAQNQANSNRGATELVNRQILLAQDRAVPRRIHPAGVRQMLQVLGFVWSIGGKVKRRRDLGSQATFSAPVISVGGISMGGAGKTPMVRWLARRLRERGYNPAILTRGYKRQSQASIIIPRGEQADLAQTGDEVQMFVRDATAHVGVSADRANTGVELERLHSPGVFLLDDGFQHARIARELDLVLIDSLDPFGGGAVFPEGGLREPLAALSRASGFVLTKTQPNRTYTGVIGELRRYNASAPVFLSRIAPGDWVRFDNLERRNSVSFQGAKVGAFCGLANPGSFCTTLRELGISPVLMRTYRDHHKYSGTELDQLLREGEQQGLAALLTTEKDRMNIPAGFVTNFPVWYLEIDLIIRDEGEFIKLVEKSLQGARRAKSQS